MKQPIKQRIRNDIRSKKNKSETKLKTNVKHHNHPQYGTSKLEEDFAHIFLDKLELKYEYQFEAKDIGRFYDFYLPEKNILIEVDGDYWHGNKEMYEESELKGFQKRAHRVDELKDKWALLHGIPIIRIWEHDIRKNPEKVFQQLSEHIDVQDKIVLKEKKNHFKIKDKQKKIKK